MEVPVEGTASSKLCIMFIGGVAYRASCIPPSPEVIASVGGEVWAMWLPEPGVVGHVEKFVGGTVSSQICVMSMGGVVHHNSYISPSPETIPSAGGEVWAIWLTEPGVVCHVDKLVGGTVSSKVCIVSMGAVAYRTSCMSPLLEVIASAGGKVRVMQLPEFGFVCHLEVPVDQTVTATLCIMSMGSVGHHISCMYPSPEVAVSTRAVRRMWHWGWACRHAATSRKS